jgi:hypothetical protein
MTHRLEPKPKTTSRQTPESENTGDASPFMTVFVARSVVRKFWISVLFLILAVTLSILIVLTLVDLNQSDGLTGEQLELKQAQAGFTVTVLSVWAVIFLILCIGFLISVI